ncbi:hypothetical protein EON67_00740 [archaeon]|nr:MAG: hypothetical protein EON67_00740 [archaeon]
MRAAGTAIPTELRDDVLGIKKDLEFEDAGTVKPRVRVDSRARRDCTRRVRVRACACAERCGWPR